MQAIRCDKCGKFEEGSGNEIQAVFLTWSKAVICEKCYDSLKDWWYKDERNTPKPKRN